MTFSRQFSSSAATSAVTYQEKENSALSLAAKLLYTAFEKHKVVDPGKWFQSAVNNYII